MTLSRLAKLANVAVSTASKAFSMSSDINEQTREEIFRVARENGCFKKFFNAKYPKFTVALICPEVHSQHYSELCFALQRRLQAGGCELCISSSNFSAEAAADRLDYYEKYSSTNAIILIDAPDTVLAPHETPIVAVGGEVKNADAVITLDYEPALREALLYFKESGLSGIGFIGEARTVSKLAAFKRNMNGIFGGDFEKYISVSELRFEKGGYAAAKALYQRGSLPDALICAYDDLALGAMRFFYENGISVPEKIKIIGMDNIPHSEYFAPSLSAIDFMNEDIASATAESVFEILNGKTPKTERNFKARLILRESSANKPIG